MSINLPQDEWSYSRMMAEKYHTKIAQELATGPIALDQIKETIIRNLTEMANEIVEDLG